MTLGIPSSGAVPDAFAANAIEIKTKLGLRPEASYFNSGVLLVDLDRWRDVRVGLDTLVLFEIIQTE